MWSRGATWYTCAKRDRPVTAAQDCVRNWRQGGAAVACPMVSSHGMAVAIAAQRTQTGQGGAAMDLRRTGWVVRCWGQAVDAHGPYEAHQLAHAHQPVPSKCPGARADGSLRWLRGARCTEGVLLGSPIYSPGFPRRMRSSSGSPPRLAPSQLLDMPRLGRGGARRRGTGPVRFRPRPPPPSAVPRVRVHRTTGPRAHRTTGPRDPHPRQCLPTRR